MDAVQALILGIIQGVTEWLPISSSGHLVIAQNLLGLKADQNLFFDLVVHLGTIVAVIVYFRVELWRVVSSFFVRTPSEERRGLRRLGLLLLAGTVPIALAGVLFKDQIESVFDIRLVGVALIANAGVLWVAHTYGSKGSKKTPGVADAIIVGVFQVVSIIPGISRSGSTLSGGMMRGLEREAAAVFAFLLSVPALLGASAYGLVTLDSFDATGSSLVLGFSAALVVGLASIEYLLRIVRSGRLWIFAVYCAVAGVLVVAVYSL